MLLLSDTEYLMACLHSLYGHKIFNHINCVIYSIILNRVDEKSVNPDQLASLEAN